MMRGGNCKGCIPRIRLSTLWLATVALLLASTNAFGRVIDDWNLDQTGLTINYPADPMGIRKSNSIAGTEVNVLGGERDMTNMLIQGSVPGEFDVKVQSGLFIFDQGMTLYGSAMFQWDGYDSSP